MGGFGAAKLNQQAREGPQRDRERVEPGAKRSAALVLWHANELIPTPGDLSCRLSLPEC